VPERLVLESVEQTGTGIIVRVRGKSTPRCPSCSSCQVSYHSQYQRQLHDLPWQGQQVRLHLRIWRFRCRNRQCDRKIFAERLPGVVAPQARETDRRCEVVRRVGYALGGLPGSRLLSRLGVSSDDKVL
jgi:transposase